MVANSLQIGGAALITAGAALIWIPAGFIVAGVLTILFGISLERR